MSLTEGRASSPCLNCLRWQDISLTVVKKIGCPPLILTVLGGRTRAHLDNSSQAPSSYLNCIGWQDKPTVTQLLCRWCLMLHFLAVTIWTLSGRHNLANSPFWCFLFGGQISPPHDLYSASETSHFSDAVKLASYSYCTVIVAWSIESRKNNGHSRVEVGFESIQTPSYYDTVQ